MRYLPQRKRKLFIPQQLIPYPVSGEKTLEYTPSDKYIPEVGRSIYGWQYSSEGSIPGIPQKTDLDILYDAPDTLMTQMESVEEETHTYVLVVGKSNKDKIMKMVNEAQSVGMTIQVCEKILA